MRRRWPRLAPPRDEGPSCVASSCTVSGAKVPPAVAVGLDPSGRVPALDEGPNTVASSSTGVSFGTLPARDEGPNKEASSHTGASFLEPPGSAPTRNEGPKEASSRTDGVSRSPSGIIATMGGAGVPWAKPPPLRFQVKPPPEFAPLG